MIDLATVVNDQTFIISDSHLGHHKILQYEPVRLEYLADYEDEATERCQTLLGLLETVPSEEQRGHTEINDLCKQLIPFHDKMLIEKWNLVVGENDTVFHLGDFAFRNIEEYTKQLNGNKILLRGNHDMGGSRHYVECGWKDVIESVKMNVNNAMFEMIPHNDRYWNGFLTEINGWAILFSHYPLYNSNVWDMKKYGNITKMLESVYVGYGAEINIHGHTHSQSSEFCRAINASTEKCPGLKPIRLGELLELNGFND